MVTSKFRRAPDSSCFYFTLANVHINNECAKRRYVCIALLLLIRDLCMKLGAVILTCDVHMGAEPELASSGSTGQRRISPPEAALSPANIPAPTASHHCEVPAVSPAVMSGPNVADLWCFQNRKTGGKLCATGQSMSSRRPSG